MMMIDNFKLVLRIIKFSFEANDISRELKVQNAKIWRKGEGYLSPQRISPYNIWIYEIPIESIGEIDEAIRTILEMLKSNSFFMMKKETWESELGIVFNLFNDINPGINLDNDILKLLFELNMSLDIDIYCLHS